MLLPGSLRSSILWFSSTSRAFRQPLQLQMICHNLPRASSASPLNNGPISRGITQSGTRIRLSTAIPSQTATSPSTDHSEIVNSEKASPSLLAEIWTPWLLKEEEVSQGKSERKDVQAAVSRTIPLLSSSSLVPASASVPFVCRYRSDIIHPLTTQQVHQIQTWISQHESLESSRKKLLCALRTIDVSDLDIALVKRILTSVSKRELDDLYAPYKPPAKGSILQQIRREHPRLAESLEGLWSGCGSTKENIALASKLSREYPRDAITSWLGSKIASEPTIYTDQTPKPKVCITDCYRVLD